MKRREVGEGEARGAAEPVVFLLVGFGEDEDDEGGVRYDDGGSEAEWMVCGGDEMARLVLFLLSDTDRCSLSPAGGGTMRTADMVAGCWAEEDADSICSCTDRVSGPFRTFRGTRQSLLRILAGGEGGGGPTSVSI